MHSEEAYENYFRATYPPVLDEQDSTKFSNANPLTLSAAYAAVYCPTYYINTKQSCVKLSLSTAANINVCCYLYRCV